MSGESRLRVPLCATNHVRGPADAPFTLVEYGDYECPHCGDAYPIVEAVRSTLGWQLRFAYRHFPLATIHYHAEPAAQAAEAANAQQKFWPMHDRIFQHRAALDPRSLLRHASAIGLDVVRFASELASRQYLPRVREDFVGGVRGGVNDTPTFYINGVHYDGPHRVEAMVAAIRDVPVPVTR